MRSDDVGYFVAFILQTVNGMLLDKTLRQHVHKLHARSPWEGLVSYKLLCKSLANVPRFPYAEANNPIVLSWSLQVASPVVPIPNCW